MMDIEMGEIKEDKTLTLGSGDEKISILLLKEEIGLGLIGMINSKLFPMNVGLVALSGKPEDDSASPPAAIPKMVKASSLQWMKSS